MSDFSSVLKRCTLEYNLKKTGLEKRYLEPVLWNRNFFPCGTGTITCQKVGTGTKINYDSGSVIN
jgi:REP element-mobilizing transposase RayT